MNRRIPVENSIPEFQTFSFRAEGQSDVHHFFLKIWEEKGFHYRIITWKVYSDLIDVAIELESTATLDELIKSANELVDCHVIAQTLRQCPLAENNLERDFSI